MSLRGKTYKRGPIIGPPPHLPSGQPSVLSLLRTGTFGNAFLTNPDPLTEHQGRWISDGENIAYVWSSTEGVTTAISTSQINSDNNGDKEIIASVVKLSVI